MTYTTLEKAVAPDRASAPGDVRLLKRMLNRLGYYTPPDKVGMTPFSDRALFDALKRFQQDNALRESGTIKPEDDTFDALESALARQNPNTQYIWHTVQDSKTRSAHRSRDGHVFSWGSPPEGGHPGDDYNCRCWATPLSETLNNTVYDPPVERVYPIENLLLAALPLANISKIRTAWQIWERSKRNTDWTLGSFKSDTKWKNQLTNRQWTPDDITNTIKNGRKYPAPNKVNPANKAIRYEYDKRYLVRDEDTKEILHVGKPEFNPNTVKKWWK